MAKVDSKEKNISPCLFKFRHFPLRVLWRGRGILLDAEHCMCLARAKTLLFPFLEPRVQSAVIYHLLYSSHCGLDLLVGAEVERRVGAPEVFDVQEVPGIQVELSVVKDLLVQRLELDH